MSLIEKRNLTRKSRCYEICSASVRHEYHDILAMALEQTLERLSASVTTLGSGVLRHFVNKSGTRREHAKSELLPESRERVS